MGLGLAGLGLAGLPLVGCLTFKFKGSNVILKLLYLS